MASDLQRDRTAPSTPTLADPAPMGLASFAVALFVLSLFNAELVDRAGEPVVLGLALAAGGVVQLLAGMWAFLRNDTLEATVFTLFGGFWLAWWANGAFHATMIPPDQAAVATGLLLLTWGVFAALLWVASLRANPAVSLFLLLVAVAFLLTGIGEASEADGLVQGGGYAGILAAAIGAYACLATVTTITFGRELMPYGTLRRA